ncbi:YolD-like protein [Thalassobacillus cyri]|uniref:YolD-like protein n=1 Tax=Thalassobacillus cyri TaxID=571932 RepID=A0A1H4C2J0_9BACI|nr:YolD-like family protein [Thalassobacillus cyri]SEA54550.1 YolD-like protein [Thalassobacillus cyri]
MDDRLRDRGTIKWTSLMLPEHVKMVKEVWKEDERIEKPILDEQQAMEIGYTLRRSLADDLTIEVKYHNGFNFNYARCKILTINQLEGKLIATDDSGSELTINLKNIMEVNIVWT